MNRRFCVLLQQACYLIQCCVRGSGQNALSDSLSDFPGLVPFTGDSALSCGAAYRRLSLMHCEDVQSTDPRVFLQRCFQEAGDAQGVIAFYVNTASWGQEVFRLRITGPEVHLPDILYCGLSAAYAEYTVHMPGHYHAEVLHLYEDFSYRQPHPALKPQILLGEHDFVVLAPPRKAAGLPPGGPAMLTSGRWVASSEYHRAFHRTCETEGDKFDACSEALRTLSHQSNLTLGVGLHWQPHLCPRLAREEDFEMRACLEKRRVCFSGDSQMSESLRHTLVLVLAPLCAACCCVCLSKVIVAQDVQTTALSRRTRIQRLCRTVRRRRQGARVLAGPCC